MSTSLGIEQGPMTSNRLSRSYCTFEGYRIAYAMAGTGPAVLLLHGLGGTADFWQPIITALAPRYMVVCPDLLGFGFSDKPGIAYTPARHAAGVAAIMRALDIRLLHALVGHSCGGVVATLLASSAVQAERLALAAAPYPSPRFLVRQELLRSPFDRLMLAWTPLAHMVHGSISLVWPLLRRLPVPAHLRGAWAGYMDHTIPSYVSTAEECLFRANLEPLLPAIAPLPTLLLYGRGDRTVPLSHGQRLHTALPRSRLMLLKDGHYAVLTEGARTLSDWIEADE